MHTLTGVANELYSQVNDGTMQVNNGDGIFPEPYQPLVMFVYYVAVCLVCVLFSLYC